MKAFFYVFGLTVFFCNVSYAGVCLLSIDRSACPGKEAEALAPYKGHNPWVQREFAPSQADCATKATQFSKIVRIGLLKQITVTATFGSVSLAPVSSQSPCAATSKH